MRKTTTPLNILDIVFPMSGNKKTWWILVLILWTFHLLLQDTEAAPIPEADTSMIRSMQSRAKAAEAQACVNTSEAFLAILVGICQVT